MYSRGIASIGSNLLGVGKYRWIVSRRIHSRAGRKSPRRNSCLRHPEEGDEFRPERHTSRYARDDRTLWRAGPFSPTGHQYGITSLVSNDSSLMSSDTSGRIVIWNVSNLQQRHDIEPMDHSGVTSLALWQNCLIAGYANGMIRIFDTKHGEQQLHPLAPLDSPVNSPNFGLHCGTRPMHQRSRLQRRRPGGVRERRLFRAHVELIRWCRKPAGTLSTRPPSSIATRSSYRSRTRATTIWSCVR